MSNCPPFPVASGCRVILAKERIGDLHGALYLLGLASSLSMFTNGITDRDAEGEAQAQLFEQDLTVDTDLTSDDDSDSLPHNEAEERVDSRVKTHDYASPRFPYLRNERSMIAYTLTPDQVDPQHAERHPSVPNYQSVPNVIQRLPRKPLTASPEFWRSAKQLLDSGPMTARPGRLDLRGCVDRIARAEPISVLPRKPASQKLTAIEILIDFNLSTGVFSSDVDQAERALRSVINVPYVRSSKLFVSDDQWFCGSGPIWTFTPFRPVHHTPTWYIFIVGGVAFTNEHVQLWTTLINSFPPRHSVSVLWLGDSCPPSSAQEDLGWVGLRM